MDRREDRNRRSFVFIALRITESRLLTARGSQHERQRHGTRELPGGAIALSKFINSGITATPYIR